MKITVNVMMVVVWVIHHELVRKTEPLDVVDLGTMLFKLRMYLLADVVNASNTARHADPRWKLLAGLAALSAVSFTHRIILHAALQRK